MNHKESFHDRKGFTVIEMIVVFAILTSIGIILTKIFISHGDIFHVSTANSELQIGATRSMDAIGEYVVLATQVVSEKTINSVAYTTDEDTVIVEIPSMDANGKAIDDTFDYAVFYADPLNGSELKFALDPDPLSERLSLEKELTDLLDTIRFIYNAEDLALADAVTVNAQFARHIPGGEQRLNFSGRFTLSNR